MAKRTYLPAIAGLRAIAVVPIVLYHVAANWMPGGFVGVDIFFVISGFVVAHSVIGTTHISLSHYYAWFYKRRLQRIMPAAFLFVLVALVASILFIPLAPPSRFVEWTGAASLVGLSNVLLFAKTGDYFGLSSELNPFTHTWSLAVEEQYYVLFPIFSYLIVVRRKGLLRSAMLGLVAVACVLSFAASAWLTPRAPVFAFYLLPTRFWELGAGFFLRLALDPARTEAIRAKTVRVAWLWSAATVAGLAYACWFTETRGFPFPGSVLPCVATVAALALFWCHPGTWLDRLLSARAPVWFGDISYSLYLWHWGVIVMMRWTVGIDTLPLRLFALGLSVLGGWLSYRFVERRFHSRERRAERPSARFFLGYASVIAALIGVGVVGHALKPRLGLAAADRIAVWDPYAPPPPGRCASSKRLATLGGGSEFGFPNACTRDATPRLIVIGDSHAGAYQRSLWRIADTGEFAPILLTMGGCRLVYVTRTPPIPGCEAFRALALRRIRELARPGDVILAAGLHTARFARGAAPLDPAEIAASRARLRALADLGVPILVEGAKPVAGVDQYRCADWFNRGNPDCRVPESYTPVAVRRRVALADDGVRRATVGIAGVRVWSPAPFLCLGDRCPGYIDGRPLYFDADHLTAFGNDRLLPHLLAAVRAARTQAGADPARGPRSLRVPAAHTRGAFPEH